MGCRSSPCGRVTAGCGCQGDLEYVCVDVKSYVLSVVYQFAKYTVEILPGEGLTPCHLEVCDLEKSRGNTIFFLLNTFNNIQRCGHTSGLPQVQQIIKSSG